MNIFFRSTLVASLSLVLSACFSVHRLDVQQGNIISQEQLSQLKKGMTQREVQHILGSPLIQDPFHASRWEYYYSYKKGGSKERLENHVTIVFEDKLLNSIEGDLDQDVVDSSLDHDLDQYQKHRKKKKKGGVFTRLWKKVKRD